MKEKTKKAINVVRSFIAVLAACLMIIFLIWVILWHNKDYVSAKKAINAVEKIQIDDFNDIEISYNGSDDKFVVIVKGKKEVILKIGQWNFETARRKLERQGWVFIPERPLVYPFGVDPVWRGVKQDRVFVK